MSDIKLSIIVPFYNMGTVIKRTDNDGISKCRFCMDALLNQTLKEKGIPYEILAVDDCSKDDTFDILKEYENTYPELVKAFKTPENSKQGAARNIGLKSAQGEWIGFMDGDDWPAPDMYEKLLKKGEDTAADVVGCDLHQVYEHTFAIGKIVNSNTKDQTGILDEEKYKSLVLNPCSMVIKIYKASVIKKNKLNFPEKMFYEDNAAAPVWMLSFKHFEKVEEPLYYYYQVSNSTTHHISEEKCRFRMKAGEILVEEFKAREWYMTYRDELEAAFTKLYYANTLFSYMPGIDKTKLGFVKELMTGLKTYFPDFEKNKYFAQKYDMEEKKLMLLHKKSSLLFYVYYKLLWTYRRIRYR